MHAITLERPGGPEVLRWGTVSDPVAGPGEVLVDVVAAGVNRADLMQRQGFYPPPPGAYPPPGYPPAGAQPGGYQRAGYQQPGYPPVGGYQAGSGFPGGPTEPIPPGRVSGGALNDVIARFGGRANRFGMLSVLAGILAICGCCCVGTASSGAAYFWSVPLAVAAAALGYVHLQKVRTGQATNTNLAMIGIGLGVLALVLAVCAGCTTHTRIRNIPFR
jgi:hypothetical protein